MPLEDLSVIDMMTTSQQHKPILYISDSGVTDNPQQRNELFQQKLKLYVSTIMNGDLASDFPGASPSDFEIRVMCANAPTPEMLAVRAVSPRGEHAHTIRVEFEIFNMDEDKSQRVQRAPLEVPEISEQLGKLIDFVLTMGLESLKSGGDASGGAVLKEGGVEYIVLAGNEDPRAAAKAYARALGPEVQAFAVSFEGEINLGGANQSAVIAEAHERGQEHGVVFAQRFQLKSFLKKFKVEGQRTILGRCNPYLG